MNIVIDKSSAIEKVSIKLTAGEVALLFCLFRDLPPKEAFLIATELGKLQNQETK